MDSGSLCSRRRLSRASDDTVLVWLLFGVLVLWTEGGTLPAVNNLRAQPRVSLVPEGAVAGRILISHRGRCWIGSLGTWM